MSIRFELKLIVSARALLKGLPLWGLPAADSLICSALALMYRHLSSCRVMLALITILAFEGIYPVEVKAAFAFILDLWLVVRVWVFLGVYAFYVRLASLSLQTF